MLRLLCWLDMPTQWQAILSKRQLINGVIISSNLVLQSKHAFLSYSFCMHVTTQHVEVALSQEEHHI